MKHSTYFLFITVLSLKLQIAQAGGVSITGSLASPQPVGTPVVWSGSYSGEQSVGMTYRWTVASGGGPQQVIRDYSGYKTLTYTPLEEGSYTVYLDVQDSAGNLVGSTSTDAIASSLLINSAAPRVTATVHPLVAIYSTQCSAGRVRVHFAAASVNIATGMKTPFYQCQGKRSVNISVAGMRASSTYNLQEELDTGLARQAGPMLAFRTGAVTKAFTPPTAMIQGAAQSPEPVMLANFVNAYGLQIQAPVAYDVTGNVIWYYLDPDVGVDYTYRMFPGGTFIGTTDYNNQVLREVDLMGNLVRETTTQRISEQLKTLGYPAVTQFSHDAIRLPNGFTAVIATIEQFADQGQGLVDVLGDSVIVLDTNWQLTWVWNPFQKLDVRRQAVLGEVCTPSGSVPCPPLTLAQTANDWTHGNALYYTSDDNILLSMRNQDWVIKIDYRNGLGSGDVLWRLGQQGDFTALSTDSYPWFTHQHDVALQTDGTFTVFDNGNTRYVANGNSGNSRGQVWKLDETKMTAALVVNDTLNGYSQAVGLTQFTSNGNLQFTLGLLFNGGEADTVEVDATNTPVFRMSFYQPAYRVERMPDLYTPEN